jgi:hypothetical protein
MAIEEIMSVEQEKQIMFEIYREPADYGCYRVVYFTELGEHEREREIGNALRGDHIFDGFLLSRERWQAKQAVQRILERLNNGATVDPADIEHELKPFMAS